MLVLLVFEWMRPKKPLSFLSADPAKTALQMLLTRVCRNEGQ